METIHACLAHAEAVSTSVSCVAGSLNHLVPRLGKRGPHRVLTGDLNFAGIPGRVYTPAEGKGIPGIAFGHDWRVGVKAYHATLRHLASWGFAVAAPDRKGTRLNSSHVSISYAVFCLKKKNEPRSC